jgi:pyruvate formate lyase activating enzyme
MDSFHHREVTGVPNELILSNLRSLSERGHKIVVRVPLVPGINNDEKNLTESGKFLASLPHLEGVELLGYHDIAQAKYEALGWEYTLPGTQPPAEAEMRNAAEVFRRFNLKVKIA